MRASTPGWMSPDVEACPAPPEEHKGSCLPAHCNRKRGEEWMGVADQADVRPETAAEATGRPPGKSLGAVRRRSIHWRLSTQGGLESDSAFNEDAAGWDCPCTGGCQTTGERRETRRSLEAWQAGRSHSLTPLKPQRTGEWRGKHTRHGALGCSIHWRRSNHRGLESGAAWTGGVARWEQPYTTDGQSCVVRGRLAGMQAPTLPLLTAYLN
jgi:hypothetical protein